MQLSRDFGMHFATCIPKSMICRNRKREVRYNFFARLKSKFVEQIFQKNIIYAIGEQQKSYAKH